MEKVFNYSDFLQNKESISESEIRTKGSLCDSLWVESQDKNQWILNPKVKSKLLELADQFFSSLKEILGSRELLDVQITGPLANLNPSKYSDLDIHLLVNMPDQDDEEYGQLNSEITKNKISWDSSNDLNLLGFPIDFFIHDIKNPHSYSGLYSIKNDSWISSPVDSSNVDPLDYRKKYHSFCTKIDKISNSLSSETLPLGSKDLYKNALRLKERIHRMGKGSPISSEKEDLSTDIYKNLKKEGYIEKLVNSILGSYSKIFK
jgi:hypothetical protein